MLNSKAGRFSRLVIYAIASLLIASVIPLSGCTKKKAPTVAVGQKLPQITLTSASGSPFVLPSGMEGKLSVILFWSKGCNYCKREMPLMQPLYEKYADKGFLIVGVHEGNDPEAVDEMVKANALTFPMLVDSSREAEGLFGIVAVPTMFVIAPDGTVKEKVLGGLPVEQIEKLVFEGGK